MRATIFFLCLSLIISLIIFYYPSNQKGKRVIIVGEGVTGLWAAAKISENLTSNDELVIISPPQKEIVKYLGHGVFLNYTTSAFVPIGIQIETGVINLEPPSQEDVRKAQLANQFTPDAKLYVSPYLDEETKNKFERYLTRDPNKNINHILLRYHREVCLAEWKKYIEEAGHGADIVSPYLLTADVQVLEKVKDKIIRNRIDAGYSADKEQLKVLGTEKMSAILPDYSAMIKDKKLSGLIGLEYDGRVKSQAVMETLNKKIENGKPKLSKIHAWVESLQTNKNEWNNTIVTGIKLRNGKTLHADVIVLALGQGIEKVLNNTNLNIKLPILKKWGVVYSLPRDHQIELKEQPTILLKGVGIVRDMPQMPITFALGEWYFSKGEEPDPKEVINFVKESSLIWNKESQTGKSEKIPLSIFVQPRPMTLDGLPVLDSRIKGLIILNPSGSQGNTQAPGSAYFAASKVLEQLGRKVPTNLKLESTVDWKQFELYPNRF